DTEGNLYSVTDPEGNKTRYDYEDGKVVSIRDAAGGITSLTYDENGNINTITDKAGVTTTYECDSLGRVLATIDALGNRTEYTLDSSDNITSVTDPLGNRTSYTYNSAGLLTQLTNPDGTTRTWAYNEIGRPAFYTDEEDRTTAVFYNKSWKEEKITLPNGGDILYTYDLLGNRIAVTDPEGRKTTYTHDRAGNVLSVGKGNATTYAYTYDSRNRIKTEVDGEGNTTAYEYDKNGKVTCITDALGGKTYQEFDGLGRLIVRKDPVGRVIRYTYNSCGMLESTTDAAGVVTKNYYKNDRLIKVTECKKEVDGTLSTEQVICAFEYDECGRVSKRTERDGFFINVSYDGAGRVVCIDCSNNRKLEYKYDSCGRRISISDCGIETRYTYTGTGKIKSILDALGNETRYEYTETDHIKSITRKDLSQAQGESLHSEKFGVGQDGHVTFFEYDLTGNITCEIDALGQKTVYQYDDKGDLCQKTDRDGNDTVYTRDNNGNIIGIDYSDGTRVTYSYNALKVLQEVKDKLGTTRIVSDCLGRTTNVINPDGNTVGYEYDIHDKKAAVIHPDGKRAEYEYDAYGRLTALMDGSDTPITYDYDESGRLKCKNFPNGTSTEYDYYAGGQLKSLTSRDINGLLDRYEYKYNERGNNTQTVRTRRELDNLSGVFDYSYDVLGRLTGVSRNGMQTAAYAYDAFGNRIRSEEEGFTTEYNYDALDRLIQKTELKEDMPAQLMAYSYDKRGNLVSETRNGELYRSYAYGITGMLEKSILDPSNELETTISYAYNFMDQRVSKTTSTDNISYLTDVTRDHFNVLAEESSEGVKRYIYDDNVVSFEKSGVRNYYQQDELGSTMYLTGTDGVSYSPYAYDTFGKRINPATGKLEHGYTKNGNIIQLFAFTGYQEEENGLYFAQVRNYDPKSGRFTGEDRVRGYELLPDSINHYLYCFNDPRQYVDMNGREPITLTLLGAFLIVATVYVACVFTINLILHAPKPKLPDLHLPDIFPRTYDPKPRIETPTPPPKADDGHIIDTPATNPDLADHSIIDAPPKGSVEYGDPIDVFPESPQIGSNIIQSTQAGYENGATYVDGHMVGQYGTKLPGSVTKWKGQNGSERVDVENARPGVRPGNVHYHAPNNEKYMFNPNDGKLYSEKTGELAPPKIQKALNNPKVRDGINKGLRVLNEKPYFK
ncbi:MAG: hypothetical protein J5959_16490, partial [Butyrivibrio sp.]|nr:hypothetical protein [Butyrivibrio sp.]